MKNNKKIILLILIITIVLLCIFISYKGEGNTLVFLSDYQDLDNININKDTNLKNIFKKINQEENNINRICFLGDYQNWPLEDGLSNKGIEEIKLITQSIFNNVETIFISGNHDYKDFEKDPSYYASTGLYKYKEYYLYLINFSDYFSPYKVANELNDSLKYLNKNKPIFILSHMPLHHTVRDDNGYSYYIFDILNKYAKKYDIIYLFGHNHSLGYDNEIGGSIVYKKIGETIKIKYGYENVQDQKLNFTYMNAGYVGYYNDYIENSNIKDNQKYSTEETISVFKIYDNKILINRYTENGVLEKYEIKLKN